MNETQVVLVADDDADIRGIICSVVASLGYVVIESADGRETLAKIAETEPDLLILDWMMPHMTGIEVCQQVKRTETGKHIPVLILTARDAVQDKVEAFEDGADDYITKPFDFKELQARVRALLRMRQLQLALYEKNRTLQSMQSKLVEQERQLAVTQLAGTAAHRIGQPLSAMLLNLYLLDHHESGDSEFKKVRKAIEFDLRRAIALIEELKQSDANSAENYFGEMSIFSDGDDSS